MRGKTDLSRRGWEVWEGSLATTRRGRWVGRRISRCSQCRWTQTGCYSQCRWRCAAPRCFRRPIAPKPKFVFFLTRPKRGETTAMWNQSETVAKLKSWRASKSRNLTWRSQRHTLCNCYQCIHENVSVYSYSSSIPSIPMEFQAINMTIQQLRHYYW